MTASLLASAPSVSRPALLKRSRVGGRRRSLSQWDCTTCLRTSAGYLLGIGSSSLSAGGFQKRLSAKPGSDHALRGTQHGLLRLLPFELRYLSSRKPPHRWVIDLSANDAKLLAPELYYTIENPEDRLFVPDEYRELFESAGWVSS
jgi:hypothetical protein